MVLFHCAALFVWGLSTLFVFQLIQTGWYGVVLGYEAWEYEKPPNLIMLSRHTRTAKLSVRTMVLAVLAIEGVRVVLKLPYIPFFGAVHLPILVLFALFLLLTFMFNGKAWRRTHKFFAVPTLLFGIATVMTGDILVYRLLWL